MGLTRPEELGANHDLSDFRCGEEAVDAWLQRRAHKNQQRGASKVFVVCDDQKVVGFYTLSASSIVRSRPSGRFARGMPDPIPVILLGQLGVDQRYQRKGIAKSLVKDGLLRSLAVSRTAGVTAVYVDALKSDLIPWYQDLGFDSISEEEPTAMMIRMKDVDAVVRG